MSLIMPERGKPLSGTMWAKLVSPFLALAFGAIIPRFNPSVISSIPGCPVSIVEVNVV